MVFFLIYTSSPRGQMTPQVLEEITQSSQKNNAKKGITGMLLGIENKYLQYLEGEEKDVLQLMEKIKTDRRHEMVTVWVQGNTEERVFSDWSMGSWMLSNEQLNNLSALVDLKNFLQNPSSSEQPSKKFIALMNGLLKTWIAHEPEE